MTALGAAVDVQLAAAGAAVIAVAVVPPRVRRIVGATTCAALCVAGATVGGLAGAGRTGGVTVPAALALDPVRLSPDRLGGVFVVVAAAVGLLVSVYASAYAHGPANSRTAWVALPLFLVGMQLVPEAADAVSFLLAWELMALASTALLLAGQAGRAEVRSAALWYAVMTQLSFLLLLAGFGVLAGSGGGTSFAHLHVATHVGSRGSSVAFLLLLLGFATKAGLVPLHVWLPTAHPEAPSHVSAAMSAAMVKTGVYGAMLVTLRLMPGGPGWWGAVVLAVGAVSAMYGVLQASVASDLKRLLAYSTTENVGLMFLALGAGLLLRAHHLTAAGDAALTGCLLLVVSHAAFKATLFLGAGSVLAATGERDLDRLGGLWHRMPWTAATFGVGCLGAASLPVTSGFVAEWALLQSLIHGAGRGDRLVAVAMPLAVSVVALTAGLALMAFTKAFGIAFLARPRSPEAGAAVETALPMRVAVVAGAAVVVLVGLLPGAVSGVLAESVGAHRIATLGLGGLDLSPLMARLDPVALALLAVVVALPVLGVGVVAARRRPRRAVELAWGCGGARTSPRMQYTATSYAEPLLRVFDDALRPDRDIEVTHVDESRYLVSRVQFRQQLSDVVETRLYRPVLAAADRVGLAARGLQDGSIHRYLGYSFAALVTVLLVVAL